MLVNKAIKILNINIRKYYTFIETKGQINIENELISFQEGLHEVFILFDLFTSKVLEDISYFWLHYS